MSERLKDQKDIHEVLMAYGRECEEKGCLSEKAVTIRMDLAAHYSIYGNSRELEGRIDENKMWVASYKYQVRKLFGNSYVKKSMKLAVEFFNGRVGELESQKEKTQ